MGKRFTSISKGDLKKYDGKKCRFEAYDGEVREGVICIEDKNILIIGNQFRWYIYPLDCEDTYESNDNYNWIEIETNEEEFTRGEEVEVSDDGDEWEKSFYLATIEGAWEPYICVNHYDKEEFKIGEKFLTTGWDYIRKIPQPKTIKITSEDNQTLSISEEKAKELGFLIK